MLEKNQILIVDDQGINRAILQEMLKEQYDIVQAEDGQKAIERIEEHREELALILLDLIMPVKDGFGVLEYMKQNGLGDKIPVILITVDSTSDSELRAYEYNVSDVILKPFDVRVVMRRIKNTIDLYNKKFALEQMLQEKDDILMEKAGEVKKQTVRIKETFDVMSMVLSSALEFRNLESADHIRRMKYFTKVLAVYVGEGYPEYGLNQEKIERMVSASPFHDIGKILVPESILLKPGKLTAAEFYEVKKHTVYGCEILEEAAGIEDQDFYQDCYDICKYHHERWDGGGYPMELKGDEIPISAQIVALADVYDALVSKRIYKDAYAHNNAAYMIKNGECGEFSPKMIECFDRANEDFQNIIFIRNFMSKQ